MDEISKFLRKIPKRYRLAVKSLIRRLIARSFEGLDIKKLTGFTNLYRARTGQYRILFYDFGSHVEIRAIRKRDESTYKNL